MRRSLKAGVAAAAMLMTVVPVAGSVEAGTKSHTSNTVCNKTGYSYDNKPSTVGGRTTGNGSCSTYVTRLCSTTDGYSSYTHVVPNTYYHNSQGILFWSDHNGKTSSSSLSGFRLRHHPAGC